MAVTSTIFIDINIYKPYFFKTVKKDHENDVEIKNMVKNK